MNKRIMIMGIIFSSLFLFFLLLTSSFVSKFVKSSSPSYGIMQSPQKENEFPDGCCNAIDDDNDGKENGADSDCQMDVNLNPGVNNVCWWTEWDPYSNNSFYISGWYSCPPDYIVYNVKIEQYTENFYDSIVVIAANNSNIYVGSGEIGFISIDAFAFNTSKIKFNFLSDYSETRKGVKVLDIVCSAIGLTTTSTSSTTTSTTSPGVTITSTTTFRTTTGPTSTTTSTTTTTIEGGCSYDTPCSADCGKRKTNQATSTEIYYEFSFDSTSNVTIRLEPNKNVDYDLYVNWDGTKPERDKYDCKPSKDTGVIEECKNTGLLEGTYYIMVAYSPEYSQGFGTFNLSLSCTPTESTTVSCSDSNKPCKMDCGKVKTDRSTNTKDYYMFKIASKSNVTVVLSPTPKIDYDLYVNWDGTKPAIDNYDCKSSFGMGEKEECRMPNQDVPTPLNPGSYYIMVDYYEGVGTYDLSLACSSIISATTSTTSTTTSTIYGLTTTLTTSYITKTTTKVTTTTSKSSFCGEDGYCVNKSQGCEEGYKACSQNDKDCASNDKCCCPSEVSTGFGSEIFISLFITFVLIVLVFLYLKGKTKMTFEKLYSKWSRILI
jgi:Na+-transporting methylmalonyl-CoA/oxaloacetate decarboxylase gamma subunit